MTEVKKTRTRAEVSKRYFRNADGTLTSRASTNVIGFRFEVLNDDGTEPVEVFEYDLADFKKEVLLAAAAWGMMTSAGNTIGGRDISPEERAALIADRFETFVDGEWTAERASGPRNSQLLEALVRVRADRGLESPAEWRESVAAQLQDEAAKKACMADPHVAAALAAIKADAAAERAKASAEKAKKTAPAATLDFLT